VIITLTPGCLDESQNFLFIPLLNTRTEAVDDFEDNAASKLVVVIFETLSYFPGKLARFLAQFFVSHG
jgi:hypothetical protein